MWGALISSILSNLKTGADTSGLKAPNVMDNNDGINYGNVPANNSQRVGGFAGMAANGLLNRKKKDEDEGTTADTETSQIG